MAWAGEQRSFEGSPREGLSQVGTGVLNGIKLAVDVENGDVEMTGLDAPEFPRGDVADLGDEHFVEHEDLAFFNLAVSSRRLACVRRIRLLEMLHTLSARAVKYFNVLIDMDQKADERNEEDACQGSILHGKVIAMQGLCGKRVFSKQLLLYTRGAYYYHAGNDMEVCDEGCGIQRKSEKKRQHVEDD
jgi:hypothetical protein